MGKQRKEEKESVKRHNNECHYRVFSVLCLLKHGLSHFLHTLSLSKTFIYYPETPTSKREFSVITLSLSQNMKIPCFSCFSPSTTEKNNNNDYPDEEVNDGSFRLFTHNQLKLATRNFHSSEKVGEGGFGSVFKGKLVDGSFVAVKVLAIEVESMRGEREFVAELASLANVKHQNLVSLKGCCVEGAHRYLVYDYMENNSLYNTFLGSEERRTRFNWEIRKDVSIGVARGLDFLHEEVKPHIVHRDIKAKNILLDRNFIPKISDFGLAKLLRDEKSYISTGVAGTLGYLAPEYANSGQVSRKSDVYSFGVLLLQIVSGLAVVDAYQDIERFIVEKAWAAYQSNDLLKLVDPMLNMNFPEEEALKFLKVGLLCVQETAKLRPRMSEVVEKLTNDIDMRDDHISKPGFVADLRNIRIKQQNLNSSQESSSAGATFTSSIWSSVNLARYLLD